MTCIRFLSNNDNINFDDNIIYITFSRVFHSQHINHGNVLYFFDIDPNIDEKEINSLIEKNLFDESIKNHNDLYPLSFKYIYKYYLTYTQFYNRLHYLINQFNDVDKIQYSTNISFIFSRAVQSICENHSMKTHLTNEEFDGFSYRHNEIMLSDIPDKQDTHILYVFLYAMYLRVTNHKIFLLPSSFVMKLPNSVNILKSSIFALNEKIKRLLGIYTSSRNLFNLSELNFSREIETKYKLDRKIWGNYRNDQLRLIEHLINIFFEKFTPNYLLSLHDKIRKLLRWSNTKCVILDETIDAYRRLIASACDDEKIDLEYMPHGIISEHLQFSYTSNENYVNKYVPKTLAWNSFSSDYLKKMNLSSVPITFPINISPRKKNSIRDVLVMLSYGDRVNLNQFEEDIVDILEVIDCTKYKIDWKIHQNIFEKTNKIMKKQKSNIEKMLNVELNFINHNVKSSSIMKNYDFIIFTTYTTGIYEAALLNVPFIIYSNETEVCNGVKVPFIPIAKNKNDFRLMLNQNNSDYLSLIKKSLLENISLDKYLLNKVGQKV